MTTAQSLVSAVVLCLCQPIPCSSVRNFSLTHTAPFGIPSLEHLEDRFRYFQGAPNKEISSILHTFYTNLVKVVHRHLIILLVVYEAVCL